MRSTFVLLVLLLTSALPQASHAGAGFVAPWWPPGTEDVREHLAEGWNLRIPLRVPNPQSSVLAAGAPVQVHLDLASSILQAGWPSSAGPNGPFPRSFHADPESLRLVRYAPGWTSVLGEVPVHVEPTWFDPDQTAARGKVQSGPYHPQRNALVTLEWFTPASIGAFETDHYFAYFEITENSVKPPGTLTAQAREALDALYWVGRGTTFFGYHPGGAPTSPHLDIVALQDGTSVNVSAYRGAAFPQLDNRPNSGNPTNPFALSAGQVQSYGLGVSPTHFRIDASRPVLVQSRTDTAAAGGGFVPSTDRNLLGTQFRVPASAPAILLLSPPNATGSGAQVMVQAPGQGATLLNTQVPSSSYAFFRFPSTNPAAFYSVTATAPILVQFAPANSDTALAQAPSIRGSPVGATFLGSTVSSANGRYVLNAFDAPAHVRIIDRTGPSWTTYESDLRVTGPHPFEESASDLALVPAADALWRTSVPATVEVRTDEAIAPAERGPVQLWVGREGTEAGRLVTPFGGRHGLEFRTQGSLTVFPYYDATHLRLVHHWNGDAVTHTDLGEGVPFDLTLGPQDSVTILADKPVAVMPRDADALFARFLAAQPGFLPAIVGPGEYRGFLIDLLPAGGTDPYFVNGGPGQTVRVPFQLRNLGRGSQGEPLADAIALDATINTEDWAGVVRFESPLVTLASAAPFATFLDVTLPANMAPDSSASLTIRATSTGNGNMTSSFSVIVFSRQTFGVKLWFGDASSEGGAEFQPMQIKPGETKIVPFVLRNTGSGPDTFDLTLGGLVGEWQADVLLDDVPVTEVGPVAGNTQRGLELRVRAPVSDQLGQTFVSLDAVSQASEFAYDKLSLSAELNLGSDFSLTTPQSVVTAGPGETARFTVEARNAGRQPVTVRINLTAALPTGWRMSFNGSDPRTDPVTLGQNQSVSLLIEVAVPADARARTLVGLLVSGRGVGDRAEVTDALGLAVSVGVRHRLNVTAPATLQVTPGVRATTTLSVTNGGNAPEQVRLRPLGTPLEWNLTLPSIDNLAPGASRALAVGILVPATYPSGIVPTSWAVEASDGTRSLFEFAVDVREVQDLAWAPAGLILARPGDQGVHPLRLANQGNAADRVSITVDAPDGWIVEAAPDHADLPIGVGRLVELRWVVGHETPAQSDNISVTARREADGGTVVARVPVRVTHSRVDVERILLPNPIPRDVGTVFVTVVLQNPTDVPALGLEVRLQTRANVLDSVAFEALGANQSSVAVLRWALAESGGLPVEVVWGSVGPGGFQPEGTRPVEVPARALEAEGEARAPSLVAAVLLALAVLVGFRRAPRSP